MSNIIAGAAVAATEASFPLCVVVCIHHCKSYRIALEQQHQSLLTTENCTS